MESKASFFFVAHLLLECQNSSMEMLTSCFKGIKESQGSDWWWCTLEHMNPKNDAWFRN